MNLYYLHIDTLQVTQESSSSSAVLNCTKHRREHNMVPWSNQALKDDSQNLKSHAEQRWSIKSYM